jgi:hypothetical protein
MGKSSKHRSRRFVSTYWILGGLITLLLLSFRLQDEVDIYSGRVRHSWLFYPIVILRYVEDSSLTKELSKEEQSEARAAWRRVMIVSPFVGVSPHFAFHRAIGQIDSLRLIWKYEGYTPKARRESARHMLQLWQRDGNYFGADRYLYSLKTLRGPEKESQRPPYGN